MQTDDQILSNLHTVYQVQAVVCAILLTTVVRWFPNKPVLPPTQSANEQIQPFAAGMLGLLRNKRFWVLLIAMTIPDGTYAAFGSVLNLNMQDFGLR